MTNIWTNSFEDVRKPYFEMEDPYTSLQEKKEGKEVKRWWDDDGDGKGYEEGEVEGKFKKKKKVKEEVEQVDENRAMARDPEGRNSGHSKQPDPSKAGFTGIGNMSIAQIAKMSAKIAKDKKQNEETLYTSKSSQEKIKERNNIKNKINTKPTTFEEVETWVAELVEEGYDLSEFTWEEMTDIYLDEASVTDDRVRRNQKTFGSNYTPPRDWDQSANRGKGAVLNAKQKEKQRRKSLRQEEVELDEAGSSAMPPRGDYQTTTATATQKQDPNAPLIAAKAKAAKAKVTKEIADLQVAKQSQRMKVDTNESVILYLAHRPDAFANLEEGVFDPKKSKMRSAEARSQRTMTSAQRAAAKKEGERTAKIHSKGETVLAGLTKPQKKSSQPMGSTQPSKPAAPAANRKVTGKYDQLAKKASAILKSAQDK
jgi:hypothetical protein